jgi:hypothetical protein
MHPIQNKDRLAFGMRAQLSKETNSMPRKTIRRALTLGVLAIAAASIGCSSAPPAKAVTVGIGDNGPTMFDDVNYQALGTQISRKIVPWDFHKHQWEIDQLDLWVAGATRQGVQPLIAFNHSATEPKKLPSVAEYKQALQALLARYPGIKTISPWNEANHVTQPTYKKPKRAAEYYNATKSVCKGCRIVAADVLDQKNMLPWLKTFRKTAKKPNLWGLHSYADANKNVPFKKSQVKKLLGAVPGRVWLTEVGGLVAFKTAFAYNESRAAKATANTMKLARSNKRIERVYFYSWFGTDHGPILKKPYKWDSGLVSAAGAPRPAYFTLKKYLGK